MADKPTKGHPPTWPNGEPTSVRDAYVARAGNQTSKE